MVIRPDTKFFIPCNIIIVYADVKMLTNYTKKLDHMQSVNLGYNAYIFITCIIFYVVVLAKKNHKTKQQV